MTDDQVAAAQEVFLNAEVYTANVNGTAQPVIVSLGNACDEALKQTSYASPEDLDSLLAPCTAGVAWINCQASDTNLCPASPADIQNWQTRYTEVYDVLLALNAQLDFDMVTTGPAGLQSTQAAAQSVALADLQEALAAAQPPVDFTISATCAQPQIGLDPCDGVDLAEYLFSYPTVPDYGLQGTNIVNTLMALNASSKLSGSDTITLLQNLANDSHIELGTKLYIEQIQYNSGLID